MSKPAARTLPTLIDELAANYPQRPAVTFEGRTVTFAEFRELALDFARALRADGVTKGDKVGILMGNRIEWLIVNFAIQYVGGTMVALNTWYTPRELQYVLNDAEVAVLIAADRYARADYVEMLAGFAPLSKTLPSLRRVVMLGDRLGGGAISYHEYLRRSAKAPDSAADSENCGVGPEDIAYILYTSGSTAHPKGVLLQHDSLIENMWNIGERLHYTPDDTIFLPISLFWGLGCENMLLASWTHAMHIVLQAHFDAGEALQLTARYRCTALVGTPNIIHAIFQHPDRGSYDISSLRKGIASGSPEATREVIETAMPLACHCYGLTESYGFATVNDASDPVEKRAATEGKVLPGTELRVVDPSTRRELPRGETGEVWLRGHVMPGYHRNPDANATSFDDEGFFNTGDLGMLDDEGYFVFKGRLKEMLKTGGMNVPPVEVEEVLRDHPDIAEAFVTGLPDPVLEEAVAAIVVLRPSATLTKDDVIAHCRASLASYKVPRHVLFTAMDRIPQTSTSKVHRMRLADLFQAETKPALSN